MAQEAVPQGTGEAAWRTHRIQNLSPVHSSPCGYVGGNYHKPNKKKVKEGPRGSKKGCLHPCEIQEEENRR